jgi:diaminopimelate epimerase
VTDRLHLTKHHALGNDFLVALWPTVPAGAPARAQRLCDRRRGVGADGLIIGVPSARAGVDLRMHLWNSDGSVAEISGNGIRCLAQAEARRREATSLDLVIETLAGDRAVQVRPGPDADTVMAQVDMGTVGPGPALAGVPAAPTVVGRRVATVDIGNPHVVILVDDPDAVDVALAGPVIEALFPDGINVHFVAPEPDGGLHLRVWERGAGVTDACGSGAGAAAVVAHAWGLVGARVRIRMPGGDAEVLVGESLTLIGPSTFVADIEVADG